MEGHRGAGRARGGRETHGHWARQPGFAGVAGRAVSEETRTGVLVSTAKDMGLLAKEGDKKV